MASSAPKGDPILEVILTDPTGNFASSVDSADSQAAIPTQSRNYVWDAVNMKWIRASSPGAGGVPASHVVVDSGTVTANQGSPPWTQRIQDGSGSTLAAVTAGNALKVSDAALPNVTGTWA